MALAQPAAAAAACVGGSFSGTLGGNRAICNSGCTVTMQDNGDLVPRHRPAHKSLPGNRWSATHVRVRGLAFRSDERETYVRRPDEPRSLDLPGPTGFGRRPWLSPGGGRGTGPAARHRAARRARRLGGAVMNEASIALAALRSAVAERDGDLALCRGSATRRWTAGACRCRRPCGRCCVRRAGWRRTVTSSPSDPVMSTRTPVSSSSTGTRRSSWEPLLRDRTGPGRPRGRLGTRPAQGVRRHRHRGRHVQRLADLARAAPRRRRGPRRPPGAAVDDPCRALDRGRRRTGPGAGGAGRTRALADRRRRSPHRAGLSLLAAGLETVLLQRRRHRGHQWQHAVVPCPRRRAAAGARVRRERRLRPPRPPPLAARRRRGPSRRRARGTGGGRPAYVRLEPADPSAETASVPEEIRILRAAIGGLGVAGCPAWTWPRDRVPPTSTRSSTA